MFKRKLSMIAVVAMMAAACAVQSAPAQATTYVFVSVCGIPNTRDCPQGTYPVIFGPFATLAQCDVARAIWALGYWNMHPRSLTDCWPQ